MEAKQEEEGVDSTDLDRDTRRNNNFFFWTARTSFSDTLCSALFFHDLTSNTRHKVRARRAYTWTGSGVKETHTEDLEGALIDRDTRRDLL